MASWRFVGSWRLLCLGGSKRPGGSRSWSGYANRESYVDVFGIAVFAGGELLRDAALAAAHELGVFGALAAGSASVDELATTLAIGSRRHRLRALLDVLAAIGALAR